MNYPRNKFNRKNGLKTCLIAHVTDTIFTLNPVFYILKKPEIKARVVSIF